MNGSFITCIKKKVIQLTLFFSSGLAIHEHRLAIHEHRLANQEHRLAIRDDGFSIR